MVAFAYHSSISQRYPALVGGVIYASGLHNGPAGDELAASYGAEQAQVRERIGETSLSELPSLAAWRSVFRSFGVDPTKYRCAAEALLRRLIKQGALPAISTLVDVANLVSIRYALPVAVFDSSSIAGSIVVRPARGDEAWSDLGSSQAEHPETGEVIFADESDTVLARRWCWRQSAGSAAGEATHAALVTIEGHHASAAEDIAAALDDLDSLLTAHAGAVSPERTVLTSGQAHLVAPASEVA